MLIDPIEKLKKLIYSLKTEELAINVATFVNKIITTKWINEQQLRDFLESNNVYKSLVEEINDKSISDNLSILLINYQQDKIKFSLIYDPDYINQNFTSSIWSNQTEQTMLFHCKCNNITQKEFDLFLKNKEKYQQKIN